MKSMTLLRKALNDKLHGFGYLCRLVSVTPNWATVWKHRRERHMLPPLRLRNGVVLHSGSYDSPVLLLNEVFIDRWYEIGALPPPDANMLDIGANIGAVTLFWAARSQSLRIHGYEPNPSAFDTLVRNLGQNRLQQRVRVFSEAVSRQTGSLNLWVDIPTELSTGYLDKSPCEGGRRISVPLVGIDDVWERLNKENVWLLKIDTEGAEVDILEGASQAFLKAVKNAIVEYHDNITPGSLARCREILEASGFHCRVLSHPWDEGIIYARRD
jgi:FkbM family methyltransferase